MNLRLGPLEIDIVARQRGVIAVVEVRTRGKGSYTRALGSIGWAKRQRLKRAASRLWRERYRHDLSVDTIRFDAAAVFLNETPPRIEYIRAAF
jgi:putative endonuclease